MGGLKWKLCCKKSRVLASARMPPLFVTVSEWFFGHRYLIKFLCQTQPIHLQVMTRQCRLLCWIAEVLSARVLWLLWSPKNSKAKIPDLVQSTWWFVMCLAILTTFLCFRLARRFGGHQGEHLRKVCVCIEPRYFCNIDNKGWISQFELKDIIILGGRRPCAGKYWQGMYITSLPFF